MSRREVAWLFASALMIVLAPGVRAADDPAKTLDSLMWTGGAGVSYPLVVSASGGVVAPLSKRKEGSQYAFPGVPAVHANVDIGLGGGMVSGGLSFPVNVGYGGSAASVKAAALRTWLVDIGPERNRTYTGGVLEWLVPSHPSGKLGFGYFRDKDSSHSPRDNFVFLYVGIGL